MDKLVLTRILHLLIPFILMLSGCTQVDNLYPSPFSSLESSKSPQITELSNTPTFAPLLPPYPVNIVATPTTFDRIEGDLSFRKILGLMYQGEALSMNDDSVSLQAPTGNYTITVSVNFSAHYQENNKDKYIIITNGAWWYKCHMCQATIDGAILVKTQEDWRLDTLSKGIVELGSFGYVAAGQLIQIGPDKHGVLLLSEYGGQGYQSIRTVIITDIEKSFKVVFNMLTMEGVDMPYACGQVKVCKWGYDSEIAFVPGTNSTYYDLQLTQKGTNRDGESFQVVHTYIFSDTQYVISGGD